MQRVSRLVMVLGTFAAVFAARLTHHWLRGDVGSLAPYVWFAALLAVAALVIGLPTYPQDWQPAIFSAVVAAVVGTAGMAFAQLIFPNSLPRFVLLLAPLFLIPWLLLNWRLTLRNQFRVRALERVLGIVSDGEVKTMITDSRQDFPRAELPFTLVSAITPSEVPPDKLAHICTSHDVTLLVLGGAAQENDELLAQVEPLHRLGMRVRTLEMFYDEWLGKLPLSEVGRMALFTDVGGIHKTQYAYLKRFIDVVGALIGCVFLLIAIPLVWIGNLFGNRGPLFFTQLRAGTNSQPFRILKFRTMTPNNAPRDTWTTEDDMRVTPFGGVLRRLHLDELPQMLNILQGSLSIVGPRPEQMDYVLDLQHKLPFYGLRLLVKPGLTGWAQVKFRYGASDRDAWEKLQYDLYYVRHQSLTFDLLIISRTIRQVVFAQGR